MTSTKVTKKKEIHPSTPAKGFIPSIPDIEIDHSFETFRVKAPAL